jgi:thymidine kinase
MAGAGRIDAITGPMFSGKTNRLLDAARAAREAGGHMALFRPQVDTRHPPPVAVSHTGRWHVARTIRDAEELLAAAGGETLVGVDEGQFFDAAIVDVLDALRGAGAQVTVAGLELDFRREPFGPMPAVLEIADSVARLEAVCHLCGRPAEFTQRLRNGVAVLAEEPVVVVGGAELYEARCAACFGKPARSVA